MCFTQYTKEGRVGRLWWGRQGWQKTLKNFLYILEYKKPFRPESCWWFGELWIGIRPQEHSPVWARPSKPSVSSLEKSKSWSTVVLYEGAVSALLAFPISIRYRPILRILFKSPPRSYSIARKPVGNPYQHCACTQLWNACSHLLSSSPFFNVKELCLW